MKATPAIPRRQMPAGPPQPRRSRRAAVAAAFTVVALFVTGCGGSSPGSGVAHLGSSTASTSSSTSASSSSGSGSGEAQPGSQAIAFSACMRAHGVPNFPDPKISTSGNSVKVAIGINPSISGNPHFNAAQKSCQKLLPEGGPGPNSGPPISPKEQTEYLQAAACIRAHGIPNFPDPTFSGGGVHIPKTAGINPHSPQVRAAEEACQSLIPGGLHGNH